MIEFPSVEEEALNPPQDIETDEENGVTTTEYECYSVTSDGTCIVKRDLVRCYAILGLSILIGVLYYTIVILIGTLYNFQDRDSRDTAIIIMITFPAMVLVGFFVLSGTIRLFYYIFCEIKRIIISYNSSMTLIYE